MIDELKLSDIFDVVSSNSNHRVVAYVNGRPVDFEPPGVPYAGVPMAERIQFDSRFRNVRSLSLDGPRVVVHLGPKTVYAYALDESDESRSELWRLRIILESAKVNSVNLFYRTWGAAIAVAIAYLVGAVSLAPEGVAPNWILLGVVAMGVIAYLFVTMIFIGFRRIQIRVNVQPGDRTRLNYGQFFLGTISGIIVAVIGAFVTAWLGSGRP
jgi:hypothetical protein